VTHAKIAKKIHKTPYFGVGHSRSLALSEMQRPIGQKSQILPPLSFSTLVQGDPLRIYVKDLQFLKLEYPGSRRWRFSDPSLHRFWL